MLFSNEIKRILIVIGAIVLLNITQNCSNTIEPIKEKKITLDTLYSKTHSLWPATVGNYWEYKGYDFLNHFNTDSNWTYRGFNSFGINLDTVQSEPSFYRLEIVDSIYINIRDTGVSAK